MVCLLFRALVVGLVIVFIAACATAGVSPHPGQSLQGTRSIGDLIAESSGRPIHIMFVHGIRASGPGTSATFQTEMCREIDGCAEQPQPPRRFLVIGAAPPATFVGQQVWTTPEDWEASRPFVDRRVYSAAGSATIIVDEVNWWPLVFPLKCRFLLMPEIALSGEDEENLKLCAREDAPFHPWVTQAEISTAMARRSPKAGGAWVNNILKQQLMNWGLADAVIALGPLRIYFHRMIDEAFKYAGGDA